MRFTAFVAWRYIFSRKRHNTINLITGISMAGVAVATLAIVVIMSVVNGLEGVVKDAFSVLDPHIKVQSKTGSVFQLDSVVASLATFDDVLYHSVCLQGEAMLSYSGKQAPVVIKGIEPSYIKMYNMANVVSAGNADIFTPRVSSAIIGSGLSGLLNLGVQYSSPAELYTVKRGANINLSRPESAFIKENIYVGAVANMQQLKMNESAVIVDINMARRIFDYSESVASSVEVMLASDDVIPEVKEELESMLGYDFLVLDRYEQQSDFYRILQMEKWVTFLILAFILLIASFNVVGLLFMIMIEKKSDIMLFRNIGANTNMLVRVFATTGALVTTIGGAVGILLGVILCGIQHYFGIIKFGVDIALQDYPVDVQWGDCLVVVATVVFIALFTSYLPAKAALK